ncbi:hypothetical protein BD770DRAFT_474610 [Pilaira anomala]|nr:hypothetical protein BD770DRAFT_474610 [Pilaira anomala]
MSTHHLLTIFEILTERLINLIEQETENEDDLFTRLGRNHRAYALHNRQRLELIRQFLYWCLNQDYMATLLFLTVIALLICNTETKAQVLKFIDEVYTTEPIIDDIKTTLNGFNSFCGKNKLDFMKGKYLRKRSRDKTGSYNRLWSLYVLEDKYHDKVKVFRIGFLIDFLFVANVIKVY